MRAAAGAGCWVAPGSLHSCKQCQHAVRTVPQAGCCAAVRHLVRMPVQDVKRLRGQQMRRHFQAGLLQRCLARWQVSCAKLHGVTQDRLQDAAAFAFATSTGALQGAAVLTSWATAADCRSESCRCKAARVCSSWAVKAEVHAPALRCSTCASLPGLQAADLRWPNSQHGSVSSGRRLTRAPRAGLAMRSWKAFMQLRAQQRTALQRAFEAAAAGERRQCKRAALRCWRDEAAQTAQVRLLPAVGRRSRSQLVTASPASTAVRASSGQRPHPWSGALASAPPVMKRTLPLRSWSRVGLRCRRTSAPEGFGQTCASAALRACSMAGLPTQQPCRPTHTLKIPLAVHGLARHVPQPAACE